MRVLTASTFLVLGGLVSAHGDHAAAPQGQRETNTQYAQRHMSSEHHIDTFDLRSFFHLHDLNRDGYWDKEEIEAIYGVHHVYSQKKSKDDIEHQKKADHITATVLGKLDQNGDGFVSPEELERVGLDGLPNFDSLGAEGHHYDVESEFFLHHEEQFHSTPETQTDESYNHPEDIEHFSRHEAIERAEAEKEAKYQGISVEEALKQHEHQEAGETTNPPKITRETPPEKQDPSVRFKDAKRTAEEWGTGEKGFLPPKAPGDRLRKNVPYKDRIQYKFRRSWGDF